ncbi:hypothetical protein J2Y54_001239 [Sphingomonas sp. BE123]|uniref:hypothetical protein n=1 Tax=Sphingomonas sp. BE123 TaxID=2817842 RepID=UPI0028619B91|nr:hypothetical protein [Sphingomonas sp. BE123]MDR6851746.1 hypothetical protein [Sphingomonas sp. BE123]
MNEVLRRLTDAQAYKLARSVKLDPDQAVPPPQMATSSPQPLEGVVDFDITIVALGHAVTWPAKMLWAGELHGKPGHAEFGMQSTLHILIPTREDDPAFVWDGFDYRMLPPAADDRLFELGEEAARAADGSAGKSNP